MPISVPSNAAETVPEYVTSSPRFNPRLIPENSSFGRVVLQQVQDAPVHAVGRRSVHRPAVRARRASPAAGWCSVSEWPAALRSWSGATVKTSPTSDERGGEPLDSLREDSVVVGDEDPGPRHAAARLGGRRHHEHQDDVGEDSGKGHRKDRDQRRTRRARPSGPASKYSARPPQTPAIILWRLERVSVSWRRFALMPALLRTRRCSSRFRAGRPGPAAPGATRASSCLQMPTAMFSAVGLIPFRKSTSKFRCRRSSRWRTFSVDDAASMPKVHHVARLRIDLPLDGHLEAVRVAVAVRVVALVEDPRLRLLVPVVAVQPVRRGKWAPETSRTRIEAILARRLTGPAVTCSNARSPVGTWRSLVAYLNGVQGVPGSNPGVPTKSNSLIPTTLRFAANLSNHRAFRCKSGALVSFADGGFRGRGAKMWAHNRAHVSDLQAPDAARTIYQVRGAASLP